MTTFFVSDEGRLSIFIKMSLAANLKMVDKSDNVIQISIQLLLDGLGRPMKSEMIAIINNKIPFIINCIDITSKIRPIIL